MASIPNGHATNGKKRPNFLIILADDLGYSDIGCFGSEIETPNLDKLAAEGLRFSDYHVASMCSPTRSMIMSGTDSHIAGVGVMAEFADGIRDRWNKPGHEGYLNFDVAALPELLQDAGYHTLQTGKWHLGYRDGQLPTHRGFDKCWSLLNGCSNHFAWEPVWGPRGQWDRPEAPAHHPWLYIEGDKKAVPEPNVNDSKEGWYSTTFWASQMIDYLKERTTEEKEKPFFGYLAYSATHWPLQCYPEDRDLHKGKYDDGPDALRQKRLKRLIELGLVKPDVVPHPVTVSKENKEWDDMSPGEKKLSARAMECFAGMVTCMDRETGRVLDYLKESGELDNTVIMFMSDNGAEGASLEAGPTMGKVMLETIDKYYDNSYENLGNHNSYIWYGPRWAQASTAPMRLGKRHTTEGGIRVPLIVRYPDWTASQYKPGSICGSFATCMDIVPTFLDLAGHKHPNANPATPTTKAPYRGHEVYPVRGKSWVPWLGANQASKGSVDGDNDAIHSSLDPPVGWELHGCAGLRYGRWKIVQMPNDDRDFGTGEWELFDLESDQGETKDLAKEMPEKLQEMLGYWDTYVMETGAVFGEPIPWHEKKSFPDAYNPDKKRTIYDNFHGGDHIEDMKAWMRLGKGQRLSDL